MKKVLTLVLTVAMGSMLFAGCGASAPETPEEAKSETYDTGVITALIPNGWMAFPVHDMWGKYEDGRDPNGLTIAKGAKTSFDLFSKPNIGVIYLGETGSPPSMSFYDDGKELEPFTTGEYTWHGYTAKSLGAPLILLWTEEAPRIQVSLWPEMSGGRFALEDSDVQAILAGIAIKE